MVTETGMNLSVLNMHPPIVCHGMGALPDQREEHERSKTSPSGWEYLVRSLSAWYNCFTINSRTALAPMGPEVNPDNNLVLSMTGRKLTKTQ